MSIYQSLPSSLQTPKVKDEEYRYSGVLPAIEKLSPAAKGSAVDVSWQSAHTFTGGMDAPNLPTVPFAKLPEEFSRSKNYFKDAALAQNGQISVAEFPRDSDELHISFTAAQNVVNSHKVLVNIGANRSVRLYIHLAGGENSLLIPQIYIDAGDASHIELIYVAEKTHNKGVVSPFFEMISRENAHASLQTVCEGLPFHRLSFMGYVEGASSHIDLRTAFYLRAAERCDLFIRIFHDGEGSTSNQMIKAVTLDEAQMNFNAQIYASPRAHNIYAYQKLTGMLLGEKSQIFARPQLDIEYYELACSHGVSIGGFDPEELFYARSRGIGAKDVYPLLLYGFFSEPFTGMPLEAHWTNTIKNILGVSLG